MVLGKKGQPDGDPRQEEEVPACPAAAGIRQGTEQKPEGEQPEEALWAIGHDEEAADHKRIKRGSIEEGRIQTGPWIFDERSDAEYDPGIDGSNHNICQPDKEFMVQPEVQGEKLDCPSHHRGVVEMAKVGEEGVDPVVNLIESKFDEAGNKAPDHRRNHQQDHQYPGYSSFFVHAPLLLKPVFLHR